MIKKLVLFPCLALILGTLSCSVDEVQEPEEAPFGGDYLQAFEQYRTEAANGSDIAQYNLAILYYFGRGVEKDLDLAFKWTKAAAMQGHTAAQYNLGTLYFGGDGVEQNSVEATKWYGYAAKAGHPEAAFSLAKMYQDGEGIDKDRVLAHAWASTAAELKHPEAAEVLASLERRMSKDQLSQAKRQYARWQIE